MAKQPTTTDITAGYGSAETTNANFSAVKTAFDNTLSRDGSTPNAMGADLDMNSNDILNTANIEASSITLSGQAVTTTVGTLTDFQTVKLGFDTRSTGNATLAAAQADGTEFRMAGLWYKVDSSLTGSNSATNDLGVDGIDLVEDVPTVDTFADLASYPYVNKLLGVRTRGYTTAGDGGGGLYLWTASQPVHALYATASTGYLELSPENGYITDAQAGVIGDNTTDDTTALQNAINYVVYNGGDGTSADCYLQLIRRNIRCTDSIFITYGDDAYASIRMEGYKRAYRRGGQTGTTIRFENTVGGGFHIDGARHVLIKNILVEGLALSNLDDIVSANGISFRQEATYDTAITNAGVQNGERYAEVAAFVIDGYNGTVPPGGAGTLAYPDKTAGFPSFIDAGTSGYGRKSSSWIEFEGVGVAGWPVGFLCSPSPSAAQGDFMSWDRCYVEYCKYGLSFGQNQGRLGKCDIVCNVLYNIFTTNTHGEQQGQINGTLHLSGGQSVNIFKLGTTANNAGITIDCSGKLEGMDRIGDIDAGGEGTSHITFVNGEITFRHSLYNDFPANVLNGNNSPRLIKFVDMDLRGYGRALSFLGCKVHMDNVQPTDDDPTTDAERAFHNGTCAGLVLDTTYSRYTNDNKIHFRPWAIDAGTERENRTTNVNWFRTDYDHCIPLWGGAKWYHSYQSNGLIPNSLPRSYADFSDANSDIFNSVSRTNLEVTSTWTGMTDDIARDVGGNKGDFVKDQTTGTVLLIKNRTATTSMTFDLLTNVYSEDGGTTWSIRDTTFDFSTGNSWVASCAVYALSEPLYMDSTASSTTLNNPRTMYQTTTSVMGEMVATEDQICFHGMKNLPSFSRANLEISSVTAGTSITTGGNMDDTVTQFELSQLARVV